MEQSIKQRIIGIVVLLIAAVVLLPVLFDGDGSYPLPMESRIPTPTPFPDVPRAIPQRPVVTADTSDILIATNPTLEEAEEEVPEPVAQEQIEQSAAASAADPEAAETPAPEVAAVTAPPAPASASPAPDAPAPTATQGASTSLDNTGLPQGWSVRLASFSNQTNARNLLERLQESGHRAYARQVSSSQGPLTAVYVGPDVDRAAVQRLQQQLLQDFQLTGIVVRYEIEEL